MENNKQETLEEAAELYSKNISTWTKIRNNSIRDFINGAKWQQEQDKNKYSEEEVYNLTQQLRLKLKSGVLKWQDDFEFDLDKWFEQFKKK